MMAGGGRGADKWFVDEFLYLLPLWVQQQTWVHAWDPKWPAAEKDRNAETWLCRVWSPGDARLQLRNSRDELQLQPPPAPRPPAPRPPAPRPPARLLEPEVIKAFLLLTKSEPNPQNFPIWLSCWYHFMWAAAALQERSWGFQALQELGGV